jgi:hypothetical protein
MAQTINRLVVVLLLATLPIVSSLPPLAQAAAISTETILNQQTQSTHSELRSILARADVRKELVSLGVNPEYAEHRIAALTDYELSQIQQHIGELPAGSSALAVLGAVFLVLIVLELVGVTNVFSKL